MPLAAASSVPRLTLAMRSTGCTVHCSTLHCSCFFALKHCTAAAHCSSVHCCIVSSRHRHYCIAHTVSLSCHTSHFTVYLFKSLTHPCICTALCCTRLLCNCAIHAITLLHSGAGLFARNALLNAPLSHTFAAIATLTFCTAVMSATLLCIVLTDTVHGQPFTTCQSTHSSGVR